MASLLEYLFPSILRVSGLNWRPNIRGKLSNTNQTKELSFGALKNSMAALNTKFASKFLFLRAAKRSGRRLVLCLLTLKSPCGILLLSRSVSCVSLRRAKLLTLKDGFVSSLRVLPILSDLHEKNKKIKFKN